MLELIGEGSFGKVFKARVKYTGQIVAIKFMTKHGKTEKEIKYHQSLILLIIRTGI